MSAIAILSAALESAGVSGVVALQHARGYKCSVLNACKQPCTRAIKQAPHARTLCAEQPKTVEVHPGPYLPPPPPGARGSAARPGERATGTAASKKSKGKSKREWMGATSGSLVPMGLVCAFWALHPGFEGTAPATRSCSQADDHQILILAIT